MDYLNFYYNKWHYSIANVTPASDGDDSCLFGTSIL